MKERKIKVIHIPVGSDPLVVEIDTSLESMQALVGGGDVQIVPLWDGLELAVDEDGKFKGLPFNFWIFEEQDVVSGDCFLLRRDKRDEPTSVTPADVAKYVGHGRVVAV